MKDMTIILETLGYTECAGLKDVKGEDLGEDFKVPNLPSNKALRLQPKIIDFMQKNLLMLKEKNEGTEEEKILLSRDDMFTVLGSVEGLQLKFDVIGMVFDLTEEEIGLSFNRRSIDLVYAHIISRDFNFKDITASFQATFANIFGVTVPDEESSPPTALPGN